MSARLGLGYVYAGDLFRKEADRRGLTLEEFGRLAEQDHSIDRALDLAMLEVARQGGVVLEGRLAGFMAQRERIPAFKVRLEASEEVRAQRIAMREGAPVDEVLARMRAREQSDALRYRVIYEFDYYDRELYDVVIDTDDRTPNAIATLITEGAMATVEGKQWAERSTGHES